jgi:fatty-acyl-CoA synthase
VAYVTLRAGMLADADELMEHARQRIPERAAVPVRVAILPSLPLTAVGKVSKPHLRAMAFESVLREAFDAEYLQNIELRSALAHGGGIVVELSGPESHRSASLALVGRFPVTARWVEQIK